MPNPLFDEFRIALESIQKGEKSGDTAGIDGKVGDALLECMENTHHYKRLSKAQIVAGALLSKNPRLKSRIDTIFEMSKFEGGKWNKENQDNIANISRAISALLMNWSMRINMDKPDKGLRNLLRR